MQASDGEEEEEEAGVVRAADDVTTAVPEVSLVDFLLARLRDGLPSWGDKPFVVDVTSGSEVRFCEVEPQSRRVASALSRRGFKQGDVLYYVTYEMAQLYVVQMAVWRLGGTVRGFHQLAIPDEYAAQIKENETRFVLVDAETWPLLHEASTKLEWPVTFLSVGKVTVPGATAFSQLLQDDGSAFPEHVVVRPREDAVMMPNTSGSTGVPKAVVHTHYTVVSFLYSMQGFSGGLSQMTLANNYAVANFTIMISGLRNGNSVYFISKFRNHELFGLLNKYKPGMLMMYPYVASWFARSAEIDQHDLTFLKVISTGGSVLDPGTLKLLETRLPGTLVFQMYGITECLAAANSAIGFNAKKLPVKVMENQGEQCVSTGKLASYVQAKVVDPNSGLVLERGQRGEILIRAPHVMKGYYRANGELDRSSIDAGGWLHTGDIGFFDEEGNVYVKERLSFLFKYYMQFVSPSELEAVLQEHAAVQGAGVVGVPHPETTSAARAFVVLRHDCSATAGELEKHVAQRLPAYMWLHGGVRFVDKLPENRGGKLDRGALKQIAMLEE